jgi:hypothetical protein
MLKVNFSIPLSFILLNNVVPLVGLLFFGWTIFDMVFFFWVDITLIYLFSIVKVFVSKKPEKLPFKYNDVGNKYLNSQFQVKIFSILIMLIWYLVYGGVFLGVIYKTTGLSFPSNLLIVLLANFVTHTVSFLVNYIGKKEYLSISCWEQVSKTLFRTIPSVLLIILASKIFGQYGMLLMFLVIKTVTDYYAHNKEHNLRDMSY